MTAGGGAGVAGAAGAGSGARPRAGSGAGSSGVVAAVDLGATSGRVMLGHVGPAELRLESVARFPNTPVRIADGLHWNILELYRNVVAGLGTAVQKHPQLASIGIDSWAVDYALMSGGRMLGTPYHYRDERTAAGVSAVHALVSPQSLYTTSGLQFLPFNTLYQLAADGLAGSLAGADALLLIPDLLAFWLTGAQRAELTNASTTGLLNVQTRRWDDALIGLLGMPRELFPSLIAPGEQYGVLSASVATELGLDDSASAGSGGLRIPVTAIGSHDTASAVVAIPSTRPDVAYISSGTWSLVGVELEHPVVSDASRAANFTNEGGVDGRVRFLTNVSGLWLLSESVRTWERAGEVLQLGDLLAAAAAVTASVTVFDASDPLFIAPGDMPARIASWCTERGLRPPSTQAEFVRSILESLAAAYATAVRQASELSGAAVGAIHVVGGGSQNALLCQLTADHTGLPVFAGPVEATALGNVLVQARAQGLLAGDLETLRALVAATFAPIEYRPTAAR